MRTFAILFVVFLFFAFFLALLYFVAKERSLFSSLLTSHSSLKTANHFPVQSDITIPFRFRLRNKNDEPIAQKVDLYFSLYKGSADDIPFYQSSCVGSDAIAPDYEGSFVVIFGYDCGMQPIRIPDELEAPTLFLGIGLSFDEEFSDRYELDLRPFLPKDHDLIQRNDHQTIFYDAQRKQFRFPQDAPILDGGSGVFLLQGGAVHIRSLDTALGDIVLQPAAGRNAIVSSGRLAVGTFDPQEPLSVVGSEPSRYIMSVANTSQEVTDSGNVLRLGIGKGDAGTKSTFIGFYTDTTSDSPGNRAGGITYDGGKVAYETSGADFAEYFLSAHTPPAGVIMGIEKKGADIASSHDPIIGVVTRTAGFIGNNIQDASHQHTLIGLVGQLEVLVRVDQEKPIRIGDLIGVGELPGVGVAVPRDTTHAVGYVLRETDSTNRFSCYKYIYNNEVRPPSRADDTCSFAFILLRSR